MPSGGAQLGGFMVICCCISCLVVIWAACVTSGIVLLCVATQTQRQWSASTNVRLDADLSGNVTSPKAAYPFVYSGQVAGFGAGQSAPVTVYARNAYPLGHSLRVRPQIAELMTNEIFVCPASDVLPVGQYAETFDGIDTYGCYSLAGYQELIAGIVLTVL